jgi:uncharacterized metal-binding protein YceD (DUF177 family)
MPKPETPRITPRILRLATLPTRAPTEFLRAPDAAACAALAERLGVSGLRKLRLAGRIAPRGPRDWELSAHLGATVTQPCTITLAPVTTRIEEEVARRYLADWTPPAAPEQEMPEDDSAEPLPETVDLDALMEEALALALPAFPRAPDAELGRIEAAPPGAAPFDAAVEHPFAALADMRRRMEE